MRNSSTSRFVAGVALAELALPLSACGRGDGEVVASVDNLSGKSSA